MIIGWIIAAVSVAVSYDAHKKAKKAQKAAEDAAKGVLINKNSNIDFLPVIYGTRRVGGTRVFISTKDVEGGDENEYLYIALALGEGEITSVSNLKFDDIDASDVRFENLYDYEVHLGTDDQAASTLLQEAPGWTSSHRLRGVAYLAIRLKYDQDAWQGIPDITCVVQGKKVYDPRNQQTDFSNNPALVLYDYLTNTRYGKGLPTSNIDTTSFISAANDCDRFETPYENGNDIKVFQCDYVLQPSEKILDNVREILGSCRGFLPFTNGKYTLKIDKAGTSVETFNTDNIIGGIQIKSGDKSETFNRYMVKFANEAIDYQPDQASYPDAGSQEDEDFLDENNDERLQETTELKTCTNFYIAREYARIILERSRNQLQVSFTTDSSGLQLDVADVITINHPTPDWGDKLFQIKEITLNADMTCNILAMEYDPNIYTYDESAEERTYPDTNLPNPFAVEPPSNLTATNSTAVAGDGSVIPSLTFNWTAPQDSFVSRYEFQYKRESATIDHGFITDSHTENPSYGLITDSADLTVSYGSITDTATIGESEFTSVIVNSPQFVITGTVPDVNYNVKVRSINDLGVRSSFITLSAIVEGDSTPPSVPSSVTATGGLKEITISWEKPIQQDYSHCEIYEGLIGNTGAMEKIAVAHGDKFVRTGLDYNETKYYAIKSVDYSENKSEFSSIVTATTLFVDSDAFSQSVNNLFAEAGAYGIEPVSSLPASGDFVGQIKYNTTSNALFRWTGSAWSDDIFSIEEASVTAASFASGIEPVSIVSSLPTASGYTGPAVLFLTTDQKLYRYDSSVPEFTTAVPTVDLVGEVAEANFSEDLMPPKIVSTLPTAEDDLWQGRQVFLTTDNKLYRYNGTEWTTAVSTTDLSGQVSGPQIADDAITNAKIAVDAIQGDVIAAAAIDGTKIADDAISSVKIAADAVTEAKLAVEAVTADIIAAGAITTVKIADTAVDADKIADSAITSAKIGADAVTTAKIANDAITTDLIAASAITTTEIGADAVTTAKIANDAVTSDVIAASAITETEIADSAVTTNKVGDSAIEAAKIATDAVTSAKIATNAVTSDAIAASAITETEISDNAVVTAKINAGAITTAKIGAGAVTADEISSNAVTTAKINSNAITSAKITAEAITSDKVATNAITASKMELAGSGSCLNDDPLFNDFNSWIDYFGNTSTKLEIIELSSPVVGKNAMRNKSGQKGWLNSADLIPFDHDKTYRLHAKVRRSTNANGRFYLGVALFDKDGANIGGDGTQWWYALSGHVPSTTAWVDHSFEFGSGTDQDFSSNGVFMKPLMIFNHRTTQQLEDGNGYVGHYYLQDMRIEEMTPASLIVDGAITTDKIDAEAVTADEIASNAITTAKIDANAITASEIASDAVTSDKIIANAVTTAKINAGAVTADEIGANAVTTAKINAGAVTADEIGANAITSAKVNANAITAGKIDTGAVTANKIGANAVTAGKIDASAVTADKIASNAVTTAKLDAGAVTADEISSNAITSAKIATNAVTAVKINAEAVTAQKIRSNAVTTDKINAGAVTADEIASNAVTTAKINAGAVTAGEISSNAITSAKIAADAITSNKIAAGAVDTEQLNAGAITTPKIDAKAITASKMVLAGSGSCLNDDPLFNDIDSWIDYWGNTSTKLEIVQLNNWAVAGKNAIRNKVGQRGWVNSKDLIPFDRNKTYRLHAVARRTSNANGRFYLGVALFDGDGANIGGDGTQWWYAVSFATHPSTAAVEYNFQFGADTDKEFASSARFMKPLAILNLLSHDDLNDGVTYQGHWYVQDLRIEEMSPASLIVDGAIEADKIASSAVTANKISANAVTANKINAGAITSAKIAADAITSDKIAANAVTSDTIAANAITSAKIAANTITAADIAANAITSSELAADSVTAGKLAAGAITADAISSGTITSDHIATGTIQASDIGANQITAGLLAASGVITSAAQITNGVITNAKIANGAISSAKIGEAAITSAKIGDLEVDTIKINDNAVSVTVGSYTTSTSTKLINSGNRIQTKDFTIGGVTYKTPTTTNSSAASATRATKDIGSFTINVSSANTPIFLQFQSSLLFYMSGSRGRTEKTNPHILLELIRGSTVVAHFILNEFYGAYWGQYGGGTQVENDGYGMYSSATSALDEFGIVEGFNFIDLTAPSGNVTYKVRMGAVGNSLGYNNKHCFFAHKNVIFSALEMKK
jgi:hypothetical protein